MGTAVGKKTSGSSSNQQPSANNTLNESHMQNSEYLLTPAYYIKTLLKRDSKLEVRSKLVSDLSVRLRTLPIK